MNLCLVIVVAAIFQLSLAWWSWWKKREWTINVKKGWGGPNHWWWSQQWLFCFMILLKFMFGQAGPKQHLSLHLTELLPFVVEARWGPTRLLLKNPPLASNIWPSLHFPYSPSVGKRPPHKHSPSLQCLWYSRWYLQKLGEWYKQKTIKKRHNQCMGNADSLAPNLEVRRIWSTTEMKRNDKNKQIA